MLAGAVAGVARHENELLATVSELGALEMDVLELDHHRRAGVELEGENPLFGALPLLLVDRLRHQRAVDEVGELRPLGDEVVFVPLAGLDDLLELILVGDFLDRLGSIGGNRHPLTALGEDSTAPLLVVDAGVGRAGVDVGLVAADDEVTMVVAAVLDATVAPFDLVLELELEVVERALLPNQEGVAVGRLLGRRRADDRAVLDRPEVFPLPALERGAVEDRREAGIGLGGDAAAREGEGGEKPRHQKPSTRQTCCAHRSPPHGVNGGAVRPSAGHPRRTVCHVCQHRARRARNGRFRTSGRRLVRGQ